MSIDPYALCPCGSGKKLKFCCIDLKSELEKIHRMIEGDQIVACVDYLATLLEKHPGRESLLSTKAALECQLDRFDDAQVTLDELLNASPNNLIGNAELAVLKIRTEQGGREALKPLMRAFEALETEMPHRVYEAMGLVASGLMIEGHLLAARELLSRQVLLAGQQDQRPIQILLRLVKAPEVPLLFKAEYHGEPCDEGVAWKADFDKAYDDLKALIWDRAGQRFAALTEDHADVPQVWRNLAYARAWQGDEPGAANALRKLVALDIPLDDAVRDEALAQLLDPETTNDKVDVVKQTFTILDMEKLDPLLQSDRRVLKISITPPEDDADHGPPPRSAFWIMDKEEPEASEELQAADIPCAVAQAYLFGRETDREARLEVVGTKNGEFEAARETLLDLGGDAIAETGQEDVMTQASASQMAMGWTWRLPQGTTPEQSRSLAAAKRQETILESWPDQPLPILDGKTPREASGNEALRTRVLAAILLLELASKDEPETVDYNLLREKLDLPQAEPIDATTAGDSPVQVTQLSRIVPGTLSDEQLLRHYPVASFYGIDRAIQNLGQELLARENLHEQIDIGDVYSDLIDAENDPDVALDSIAQARTHSEAAGQSCARWDLIELSVQLGEGRSAEVKQLLEHVRLEHLKEPGVMESLTRLLMEAGVIGPDGIPAGPPPESALAAAAPAGLSDDEIWTPGGGGETEGQEKKIWLPGMD